VHIHFSYFEELPVLANFESDSILTIAKQFPNLQNTLPLAISDFLSDQMTLLNQYSQKCPACQNGGVCTAPNSFCQCTGKLDETCYLKKKGFAQGRTCGGCLPGIWGAGCNTIQFITSASNVRGPLSSSIAMTSVSTSMCFLWTKNVGLGDLSNSDNGSHNCWIASSNNYWVLFASVSGRELNGTISTGTDVAISITCAAACIPHKGFY